MGSIDLRQSPLSGWEARFATASSKSDCFDIRELRFTTQINVRGDLSDPRFAHAAEEALGIALPSLANTWAGREDCAALWLGPNEWLVAASEGHHGRLYDALVTCCSETLHSVTDVSASRAVIQIAGRHVRAVLAKGCSLDLHAATFAPLQCAQSILAKAQVILQCVDARPVLRLYVRSSVADYLASWLLDAASETRASLDLDAERIANRLEGTLRTP